MWLDAFCVAMFGDGEAGGSLLGGLNFKVTSCSLVFLPGICYVY